MMSDAQADAWFVRGMATAAAYIAEEGEDVLAFEVLLQHGYQWSDLIEAGVDNYDLKRLAAGIGQIGMRKLGFKKGCRGGGRDA